MLQPREQRLCLFDLAGAGDIETETRRRIDQTEVLGDTQVRAEVELLIDDANSLPRRVAHGLKDDRFASQKEPAARGLDRASQDLHQRRLSRAVFADQYVDGTAANFEVHILQGNGTWKDLTDPFGLEDDLAV